VAYDEVLADRIRELLVLEPDVVEKRMFGSVAFLIGGHIAVGVSNSGGCSLRAPHDETEEFANPTPRRALRDAGTGDERLGASPARRPSPRTRISSAGSRRASGTRGLCRPAEGLRLRQTTVSTASATRPARISYALTTGSGPDASPTMRYSESG